MPMESHVARAVNRATAEATKRGHKLGSWGYRYNQAANRCERDGCDCRVLVTPGDALEVVGAAVALVCKEGGNATLEAPEPTPSGPEAVPMDTAGLRALRDAIVDAAATQTGDTVSVPMPKPAKRTPTDAELRALSMKSFGRKAATTR